MSEINDDVVEAIAILESRNLPDDEARMAALLVLKGDD